MIELFNCSYMLDFLRQRRRVHACLVKPMHGRDTSDTSYLICVRFIDDNSECLCAKLYVVSVTAYRLDNFFLWLSNTNATVGKSLNTTDCILCRQYNGTVPALGSVIMTCSKLLPVSRFVIIQSSLANDALCLTEVEVYVCKYLLTVLSLLQEITVMLNMKTMDLFQNGITT
jgi:hypothetical protein